MCSQMHTLSERNLIIIKVNLDHMSVLAQIVSAHPPLDQRQKTNLLMYHYE